MHVREKIMTKLPMQSKEHLAPGSKESAKCIVSDLVREILNTVTFTLPFAVFIFLVDWLQVKEC
jgi:hypothetical protein